MEISYENQQIHWDLCHGTPLAVACKQEAHPPIFGVNTPAALFAENVWVSWSTWMAQAGSWINVGSLKLWHVQVCKKSQPPLQKRGRRESTFEHPGIPSISEHTWHLSELLLNKSCFDWYNVKDIASRICLIAIRFGFTRGNNPQLTNLPVILPFVLKCSSHVTVILVNQQILYEYLSNRTFWGSWWKPPSSTPHPEPEASLVFPRKFTGYFLVIPEKGFNSTQLASAKLRITSIWTGSARMNLQIFQNLEQLPREVNIHNIFLSLNLST